jgi:hypothetical protein
MASDLHGCKSCGRRTVRPLFVERFHSASTLWTVPTRCVPCGGAQPVPAGDQYARPIGPEPRR